MYIWARFILKQLGCSRNLTPPLQRDFTLSETTLWKWIGGHFGGLWCFMAPSNDTTAAWLCFSLCHFCLIGRKVTWLPCEHPMPPMAGSFTLICLTGREEIHLIKSITPSPKDLLLTCLFPYLAWKHFKASVRSYQGEVYCKAQLVYVNKVFYFAFQKTLTQEVEVEGYFAFICLFLLSKWMNSYDCINE